MQHCCLPVCDAHLSLQLGRKSRVNFTAQHFPSIVLSPWPVRGPLVKHTKRPEPVSFAEYLPGEEVKSSTESITFQSG